VRVVPLRYRQFEVAATSSAAVSRPPAIRTGAAAIHIIYYCTRRYVPMELCGGLTHVASSVLPRPVCRPLHSVQRSRPSGRVSEHAVMPLSEEQLQEIRKPLINRKRV
jgi:hypothetical protein